MFKLKVVETGYPEAKLESLGVMRDLYGAAYPSSPARAKGSLHGAGLAIDTTWSIPGKKWDSIGDPLLDPNFTLMYSQGSSYTKDFLTKKWD